MFDPRKLGLVTGKGRNAFYTTFTDEGPLEGHSFLRDAYQHIEPTIVGLLAAVCDMLQNPFVLHACTKIAEEDDRPLFEQFMDLLSIHLAAIYGDKHTLRKLRAYVNRTLGSTFYAADQPQWFQDATGARQDFKLSDRHLRRIVTFTISAAIARAHSAVGLLTSTTGGDYGHDLMATVRLVMLNGDPMDRDNTAVDIQRLSNLFAQDRPMSRELLKQAEVPTKWLPSILSSHMGDGRMVADAAPLFMGLLSGAAQQALGWESTTEQQTVFSEWSSRYYQRSLMHSVPEPDDPKDVDKLRPSDFFDVSGRVASKKP